jgi:hypothetical protein
MVQLCCCCCSVGVLTSQGDLLRHYMHCHNNDQNCQHRVTHLQNNQSLTLTHTQQCELPRIHYTSADCNIKLGRLTKGLSLGIKFASPAVFALHNSTAASSGA